MAKGQVCYYCGEKLTKTSKSKEHIPPRMMFSLFDCDAVTVPSCEKHNSSKSGQDQTIVSGFMQSLHEMIEAKRIKVTPNVRKAVKHNSDKTFERTKNFVERRTLYKDLPQLAYIKVPTIDWIRQIVAGWVFDAAKMFDTSINWGQVIVHSPSWYPLEAENWGNDEWQDFLEQMNKITVGTWERGIHWEHGWGPYPADIYRFYVSFDDEPKVCFKQTFYGSFTWYVEFECLDTTRKKLMDQVRSR